MVAYIAVVEPVQLRPRFDQMIKAMRPNLEPQEIAELRAEAAEARALAVTFKCDKTIQDLLKYALELDIQATELEQKNSAGPLRPLETLNSQLRLRRLPVVIRS